MNEMRSGNQRIPDIISFNRIFLRRTNYITFGVKRFRHVEAQFYHLTFLPVTEENIILHVVHILIFIMFGNGIQFKVIVHEEFKFSGFF